MENIGKTRLSPVGESIEIFLEIAWGLKRVDYPNETGEPITLDDVYKCYKHHEGLIYVFCDGGLRGTIYRCNNYEKGLWQKYATTQGYA
ncbi:hypothetical protein J9537_00950 [Enterococcus raffinosus]|uniref:hypothetical protein n=1 Tax=Enterococcus raffinosus TaxID=71452 RepID=UPI001C4706E6|nr:hypothetical protein [Enterococcus raffinosus]QXJ59389.1 hypothetical protein J9537_00950 [Enterococcus raffinosus]